MSPTPCQIITLPIQTVSHAGFDCIMPSRMPSASILPCRFPLTSCHQDRQTTALLWPSSEDCKVGWSGTSTPIDVWTIRPRPILPNTYSPKHVINRRNGKRPSDLTRRALYERVCRRGVTRGNTHVC